MFINKYTVHDITLDDTSILQVYDISVIQTHLKSSLDLTLLEKILINIGYSINSAPLFKQYLSILVKLPDENTKIEKIRNTFFFIIQIPMHGLHELYNDYEEFEMDTNKIQGKKILQESFHIYQNTLSVYNQVKKGKDILYEMENPLKLNEEELFKRISFLYKEALYFNPKDEEVYFLYSEYLIKNKRLDDARKVVELGIKNVAGIFLKIYYYSRGLQENLELFSISDLSSTKFIDESIPQYSYVLVMNYLTLILKKEGLYKFRKEFINYKIKGLLNDIIYKNIADYEFIYSKDKDIVTKIYTCGIEDTDSQYLKNELINFLLRINDYNNAQMFSKKYNIGHSKLLEYEYKYGTDFYNMLDHKNNYLVDPILQPVECITPYEITKINMSYRMNIEIRKDVQEFINSINYIKRGDNLLINCNIDKFIDIFTRINL